MLLNEQRTKRTDERGKLRREGTKEKEDRMNKGKGREEERRKRRRE